MKKKKGDWLSKAFIIFAVIGIIISSYATYHHYKANDGPSFCNVGENFNCDIVNKSEYAEIKGIPVAVIGIIGYLFLLYGALVLSNRVQDHLGLIDYWKPLLALSALGGFSFAAYLTYIEAFVLEVWCPICISSQIAIIILLVLSLIWWKRK